MAQQCHSKILKKIDKNLIRTQLITNTEMQQKSNQHSIPHQNFNLKRVRSPTLPPIDKTVIRQSSNNSDQSSGYFSGGNGLPYEYSYSPTFGLADNNETYTNHHNQSHVKCNKILSGNLSLASSRNGYSSSNIDHEMDFNNINNIYTPSSETSSTASNDFYSMSSYVNSSAIESPQVYQKFKEGGRAKWGSYLFDSFSKNSGRHSRNNIGPIWLEKKLNEARDSEEETMSISVQSVSSFLRGQNVPIDPMDLAERESKRRIAIELQNAIKEQLLERENIKKMEKEKQWQLEKLEEERMTKKMELERQKLVFERQLQNENIQNERKSQEIMRLALEKATFEAKFERERKKRERALANSLDETITIQRVGEKTGIFIEDDRKQKSEKQSPIDYCESTTETMPQTTVQQNQQDYENDGETMLIGTPIKLKKKNLDSYRRKLYAKRYQQTDNSKSTSDEDASATKCNIIPPLAQKTFSNSDVITLVPFVPITNDIALNHYNINNLPLLMTSHHTKSNAQNMLFSFIANPHEKPDSSKISATQPTLPNSPVYEIQQIFEIDERPIRSKPSTPKQQFVHSTTDYNLELAVNQLNISVGDKTTKNESACNNFVIKEPKLIQAHIKQELIKPLKDNHLSVDTFTKSPTHTQDAFTSTINESGIIQEPPKQNIKLITPKKYRDVKQPFNSTTIGTQTESYLLCEYCSFQQHHIHYQQLNSNASSFDVIELTTTSNNQEVNKSKDKNKIEDRPRWGSRIPPIKYVKASDKDPFYASMKNRKKRYIKKSDKDKYEEVACIHKDCSLVSTTTYVPLLSNSLGKGNSKNFCSEIFPIKKDKSDRVYLLPEDNIVIKESLRNNLHQQKVFKTVELDIESTLNIRNNVTNSLKLNDSFYLPKGATDFQDIFID
ncbi:unnamed protein product [Diamesa serratosioi]